MTVAWGTYTRPDGRSQRQIVVSTEPDEVLFRQTSTKLQRSLGGTWTERQSEFDTRYWDLAVGEGKITLHLQNYLGITVFPSDGPAATEASMNLLERAYRILAGIE